MCCLVRYPCKFFPPPKFCPVLMLLCSLKLSCPLLKASELDKVFKVKSEECCNLRGHPTWLWPPVIHKLFLSTEYLITYCWNLLSMSILCEKKPPNKNKLCQSHQDYLFCIFKHSTNNCKKSWSVWFIHHTADMIDLFKYTIKCTMAGVWRHTCSRD